MATQIPWNFLKGQWQEKGCLPAQYKQYEPHFKNGTAGAAAAVPPLTAAQERAVREAIESRQTAGAGNPGAAYTGPDFQTLVENLRDKKNCTYVDACMAVLRTEQGQRAHRAFLEAKNPGINFD